MAAIGAMADLSEQNIVEMKSHFDGAEGGGGSSSTGYLDADQIQKAISTLHKTHPHKYQVQPTSWTAQCLLLSVVFAKLHAVVSMRGWGLFSMDCLQEANEREAESFISYYTGSGGPRRAINFSE